MQVYKRFPRCQRVNQDLVQAIDTLQFVPLRRQHALWRVEDLEQPPQAHRTQMRDHVQGNESFFWGHVRVGSIALSPNSRSSTVRFSTRMALPSLGVSTKRIFPFTNFLSAKTLSRIWVRDTRPGSSVGRSNRLITLTSSSSSDFGRL